MALLGIHPDKLVAVTRAIQNRPRVPRPSIGVAAARVVAGGGQERKLLRGKPAVTREPGLVENLAYQLAAQHEERHLNRMARRVDSAVGASRQAQLQGVERQQGVAPAKGVGKPHPGPVEPPHVQIHVEAPQKPLPQQPGPGPIRRY